MLVDINLIDNNTDNPRKITESMFDKLCNSITEDPDILAAKPLVVVKNESRYTVLGGNMRLKALRHLGHSEVNIFDATDWSADTKRRFIVKDNLSNGSWDYDMLSSQYDLAELESWGMENIDQYFQDEPEDKDGDIKDNKPRLTITFVDTGDLESAKAKIEVILKDYNDTIVSVSGGEL